MKELLTSRFSIFPHGAHDINHHHYVPTPGKVQYFRAEHLPFLPDEAKTVVRVPKAYAVSVENLRYLDVVRKHVTEFTNKTLPVNYFTGGKVGLEATLQEAEVMFNANENVRSMAHSGELSRLHERFQNLSEQAHSEYESIRDRINNIVLATQTKEDEISTRANQAHGLNLSLHNADHFEFSTLFSNRAFVTTKNLEALSKAKENPEAGNVARQIQALLEVQTRALESLIQLQEAWVANVENDAATQNELAHYREKYAYFKERLQAGQSSDSQLNEASERISSAVNTFTQYN
jgi:hypothetical protein